MTTVKALVHLDHPGGIRGSASNTWHLTVPGPAESHLADLDDAMDILKDVYDGLTGITAGGTHAEFDGVYVTVGEDPTILNGDGAWDSTSGTSQPALPAATAICLSWGTASATRSGKGRTFISPIAQNASDGSGGMAGAARSTALASAANILSWNGAEPVALFSVWSVKQQAARTIISSRVSQEFAVLRSRRD